MSVARRLLLGILPLWAGCGGSSSPSTPPVYFVHPSADELLRLMFPAQVEATGSTRAYHRRGRAPEFKDVAPVSQYLSDLSDLERPDPVPWDRGADHTESFRLHEARSKAGRERILRLCPRLQELARDIAGSNLKFASVIEKALLQRDVYQICTIVHDAVRAATESPDKTAGTACFAELGKLWRKLLLTSEEYRDLRKKPSPSGSLPPSLPARVISSEPEWIELPFEEEASEHFKAYRGRSFVAVYIKVPGMSTSEFHAYWDSLIRKHGPQLTKIGAVAPLPAGTETLLVRTFGVHLDNGDYGDSGYPEEVLVRKFRYESKTLDPQTSDYWGTVLYQWKLRRSSLLADPGALGLVRFQEDDPSFFGFFGESPGGLSVNASLTTVRSNCIACHSEIFYGVSTVFSLARPRPSGARGRISQSGMLERVGDSELYRLQERVRGALEPFLQ